MNPKPRDPDGGARDARGWEQLSMVGDEGAVGESGAADAARTKRPARKAARKGGGTMAGSTADTGAGAAAAARGVVAGERRDAGGGAAEVSLEAALERLEAIVRELEGGNIDLDKSLALFEEGVGLSRLASKRLGEAEAKIAKLVRSLDGGYATEPFATEGDAEGDA